MSEKIGSQGTLTHHIIEVAGIKTHYVEQGRGSPLFLVNGWFGSWYAFSRVIPLLSRDFHCLAVDLPGFGKTDELKSPHTTKNYAKFLSSFLNTVGLKKVVYIGASYGALVGIKFAISYREQVRKLILQGIPDPAVLPSIVRKFPSFLSDNLLIKIFQIGKNRSGLIEGVVGLNPQLKTWGKEHGKRVAERARRASARAGVETIKDFLNLDINREIEKVKIPTLIIDGADVSLRLMKTANRLHEMMPGSRLVLIKGASHTLPGQKPEEFSESIKKFIVSKEEVSVF